MKSLDRTDRRLLERLQRDAHQSMAELGEAVGLSASACHRRVRQLEKDGVISGYAAQLNPAALGLALEFVIEVSLSSQRPEALEPFEQAVRAIPQVLECLLMSGASDYRLRVAVRDVNDFERLYREQLSLLPGVMRLESSLVLRTVRSRVGVPVEVP